MNFQNFITARITLYEILSLLISILALMLSLASFIETRNYNTKSQDYNAVIVDSTEDSLKEIAAPCENIKFQLTNLSQFPSEIEVRVEVEGFSVHWPRESGQECPSRLYRKIDLPSRVIKPGGSYESTFSIHTLSPKPKTTSIRILLNGDEYRTLSYVLNDEKGAYELDSE
jgi:hypothetical protein